MKNELHSLGVTAPTQASIERVNEKFLLERLKEARAKTIAVVEETCTLLKEGMTEDEARKLTLERFAAQGVTKHWHRPYVRFGPGTTLSFNEPVQPDYRLQKNDGYYFDVGPIWPANTLSTSENESALSYEGDYGDTFVFGDNAEAEKLAATARKLFDSARTLWKSEKYTGVQLYEFLDREATAAGYKLRKDVPGHRLSDFPHHTYSKNPLAEFHFTPTDSLWVLEVEILHPTLPMGAFFEDLL